MDWRVYVYLTFFLILGTIGAVVQYKFFWEDDDKKDKEKSKEDKKDENENFLDKK